MTPTLTEHLKRSPSAPLYHYTTQQGFLGIVESRKLWATNTYYMNDALELKHAVEVAGRVIEGFQAENVPAELVSMLVGFLKGMEEFHVFACSFSEERDLLSQWRGYTGECGYALAFKPEKLLEIAEQNEFRVVKCIYDDGLKEQIAREAVERALEIYRQAPKDKPNLNQKAMIDTARKVVAEFYQWGPLFKHRSFEEENEWRLIAGPADYFDGRIRYRGGRYTLVPYVEVNLEVKFSNPSTKGADLGFHDILVGASPLQDLPWRSVMQFLYSRGIGFDQITPSGIPFRRV